MTLWDTLVEPMNPGARFSVWEHDAFREETWGGLAASASRAAVGLRRLGVERGTRVATVLTNRYDVVAAMLGVWMNGGVVMSLPTPARGLPMDEYVKQLERLCKASGAALLLLEDMFAGAIDLPQGPRIVGCSQLPADGAVALRLPGDDDDAFVQFSSGSTSDPKGCVLTARAIHAQVQMLRDRIEVSDTADSACSWLPISHDMGLFGGLMTPWIANADCTLADPIRFLRSPRTWIEDAAHYGDTVTLSPNFGVEMAKRAARRFRPHKPLRLRTWIIGSDPIEIRAIEEAQALLGPLGLPQDAFTPAYGMAETTLSISMKRRGEPVTTRTIDLEAVYDGRVVEASEAGGDAVVTRVVSTGPPMQGTTVRIDGGGDIGEIVVRSTSMARGYLDDPERSARAFTADGELRTGDLGFIRNGEVFVVGREDDMIAVNGRNVSALEVEARIGRDERLRAGSCVLVDVQMAGRRQLVVLTEPVEEQVDFAGAAREMRSVAAATAGIGLDECIFVPRGTLPKSPSGKVQRFRCRQLATADGSALARVRVS